MGSIRFVKKPCFWKIDRNIGVHKETKEPVFKVIIGNIIDYTEDEICVFMLKSHYEKCVNREWKVKAHSYSEEIIEIFDENQNKINTDFKNQLY